jgi:predicted HTH domain antitoxin
METLRVNLPSALLKLAKLGEGHVSQESARLPALELFREERISEDGRAELCETPLAAFMDFVAKHEVPPLRNRLEDLEEERRSTDRVKT